MSTQKDKKSNVVKIIVLGSSNVGKSSLIERYVSNAFSGKRNATIGADFYSKRMKLNDAEVILQIWDTAGMERFHNGTLGHAFYRGAHGALLVYDVNNETSIEQLALWRDEVLNRIEPDLTFPMIVIGNKIDLRIDKSLLSPTPIESPISPLVENPLDSVTNDEESLDRMLFPEMRNMSAQQVANKQEYDVLQWCYENGYGHIETSAKDGQGVEVAMTTLAALAYESQKSKTWIESKSNNETVNLTELYAPQKKSTCC